jgi:hypothetical protein
MFVERAKLQFNPNEVEKAPRVAVGGWLLCPICFELHQIRAAKREEGWNPTGIRVLVVDWHKEPYVVGLGDRLLLGLYPTPADDH